MNRAITRGSQKGLSNKGAPKRGSLKEAQPNFQFSYTSPEKGHRKKKVREFPVPSRDVTTKLSLGGNNVVITELFLPRGSLVSDIPAGDGKLMNLFLRWGEKGPSETL